MDNRSFISVEAMNEFMIDQWNKKVRRNDEVVILGDFAIGKGPAVNELLEKLNGRKFLIIGNHDKMFLDDKEFVKEGFVWIKHYARMNDNRRGVILNHYPIMCYDGQYRWDVNGNPSRYMLYGHVHDTRDEKRINEFINITRNDTYANRDGIIKNIPCNMINCFCMFSNYEPLTLDEWIEVDAVRRKKLNENR